jgi:hypothetical protein
VTHPGWGDSWSVVALPADPPRRTGADGDVHLLHRRTVRRRAVRWLLVALGVVAVVVVGCAAWVAVDALVARDHLAAAAQDVDRLRDEVEAGQGDRSAGTVASLQEHAAEARDATTGVQWSVVGALPWVGEQVRAVQSVSAVVQDLATNALPQLVAAAAAIDPTTLAPVDGEFDVEPLQAAAPGVVGADASVRAAADRLARIPVDQLADPVAEPVVQLRAQVDEVAMTTATAARAVQLLPAMLGADGPRQYLVLVQNNAEQRATGGIPGSVLLLRAQDGRVAIVDQRAGNSIGGLTDPALELTAQERVLFGDNLGQTMLDVTFTPDFPRTAQLATALWQRIAGPTQVDGVLSVDPGTLALVLGAVGPVDLADGSELTADNAQQRLLNQVYLDTPDPTEQDEFFGTTAQSVFDATVRGDADPAAVVAALAEAARQGRLLVWSADPAQQRLLSGTVLSGELFGHRDDSPVVGVYLEDAGGAKIGYYLEPTITLEQTACRPDGSQALTLEVTLHSTAPADAATLPGYLVGTPLGILPPGEIWTNVLVYAPTGGGVTAHESSDGVAGLSSHVHDGLAVAGRTVILRPGDSVTLSLDLVTGPGLPGAPVLRGTPTALGPAPVARGGRCGDSSLS